MEFYKVTEWKQEFSKNDAEALALEYGIPVESLTAAGAIYEQICSDWEDYDDDEIPETNLIRDYYIEVLSNIKSRLDFGHSPAFSFEFARAIYVECGDEDGAKMVAYKADGIDGKAEALINCKALGHSDFFSERYAEVIVGCTREEEAIRQAKGYEQGMVECDNLDYSSEYIEQYATQRSWGAGSEHAHFFATCYESQINAGESSNAASCYADKAVDYLDKHVGFVWSILHLEADLFSQQNNLNEQRFVAYLLGVYEKEEGFPIDDDELDKLQVANLLRDKFSLDEMKRTALAYYHSGKPPKSFDQNETDQMGPVEKGRSDPITKRLEEDLSKIERLVEDNDSHDQVRDLHQKVIDGLDYLSQTDEVEFEIKTLKRRLKSIESQFMTDEQIEEDSLDMMFPNSARR